MTLSLSLPLSYLSPPLVLTANPCSLSPLSSPLAGWLDDIGLPQYKSHFDEARVDGRVLHYMTVVSC